MAKRAKVSMEEDKISCLPDEVLCHIISFLSLKEAFCTSILSTRWSKIFTLISNLDFDDCFKRKRSESYSFMDFVDRVLHRAEIVDKFRIKCGGFVDFYHVHRWIRSALQKKVREIDLSLYCKGFGMLPVEVFTCETLIALRLSIEDPESKFVVEVPDHQICFPRLKILHLMDIELPDDESIQRLFSSCSVLEELEVDRCRISKKGCKFNVFNPTLKRLTIGYICRFSGVYEVGIDAPSLVFFKCSYLTKKLVLKNLNSIEEVFIRIPYRQAVTDLFKGISNVQSLHLICCLTERFLTSSSQIPELPKLTYLNLHGHFLVEWERLLPDLLTCFPCLEALDLQVNLHRSSDIDGVMLPSKSFPSFLWSQLKTLKILSFKGHENIELQVVECFLKNAEGLENFTLRTSRKAKWRSEIAKILFKLPKISKNCEILVV